MEWVLNQVGVEVTKSRRRATMRWLPRSAPAKAISAWAEAGVALQHYQAGKVEVLLVTGDAVPAPWDKDANTVSGKAAGLPNSPWGVVEGFAVPKGVPQEHIDWLYKLFAAAAETEHHKQRETTVPGAEDHALQAGRGECAEDAGAGVRRSGRPRDGPPHRPEISMPSPRGPSAAGLIFLHLRRIEPWPATSL